MDSAPIVLIDKRWPVDGSYLTPAYMANFRPPYKERLSDRARKLISKRQIKET